MKRYLTLEDGTTFVGEGFGAAADAVHRAGGGKWIGVCGELAADASLTAKFLAAGADELSVSPPYIAEIKEKIRSSVIKRGR